MTDRILYNLREGQVTPEQFNRLEAQRVANWLHECVAPYWPNHVAEIREAVTESIEWQVHEGMGYVIDDLIDAELAGLSGGDDEKEAA